MVGIDTYITESDYITYATTRGIAINSDTLSADLVLSADFINLHYALKDGYALPTADTDKIAELNKAALKACELQQAGRLTLDESALTGKLVTSESKSLSGVGSKSQTFDTSAMPTTKPRTPELDKLLRGFLAVTGSYLLRG